MPSSINGTTKAATWLVRDLQILFLIRDPSYPSTEEIFSRANLQKHLTNLAG
jgi:hypothetical protein